VSGCGVADTTEMFLDNLPLIRENLNGAGVWPVFSIIF
jgi:hypothetical protein